MSGSKRTSPGFCMRCGRTHKSERTALKCKVRCAKDDLKRAEREKKKQESVGSLVRELKEANTRIPKVTFKKEGDSHNVFVDGHNVGYLEAEYEYKDVGVVKASYRKGKVSWNWSYTGNVRQFLSLYSATRKISMQSNFDGLGVLSKAKRKLTVFLGYVYGLEAGLPPDDLKAWAKTKMKELKVATVGQLFRGKTS